MMILEVSSILLKNISSAVEYQMTDINNGMKMNIFVVMIQTHDSATTVQKNFLTHSKTNQIGSFIEKHVEFPTVAVLQRMRQCVIYSVAIPFKMTINPLMQ